MRTHAARQSSGALVALILGVTIGVLAGPGTAAATPLCSVTTQVTNTAGGGFSDETVMSADGSRVAYRSDRNPTGGNADHSMEIFVHDTTGPSVTQVTSDPTGAFSLYSDAPTLSADGSSVAFLSTLDLTGANDESAVEVFLYDLDESTMTQVTDTGGDNTFGLNDAPRVSADGTLVAFSSGGDPTGGNPEANRELFAYDTTTQTTTQLTSTSLEFDNTLLSLSADGSRIVYDSTADPTGQNADHHDQLFLFDRSAPVTTQITAADTDGLTSGAEISGDGGHVTFESDRDLAGVNGDHSFELFDYDVAASTLHQVTSSTRDGAESTSPSISADGTRIAFQGSTGFGDNQEVALYDAETGSITHLTDTSGGNNVGTAISGDGGRVAFSSDFDLIGGNPDRNFEIFLAACGPSPRPDAQIGTAAAGPFVGDDLYAATAIAGQTVTAGVARGSSRSFFVRVQNDRSGIDSLKVRGVEAGSAGYTVTYLRGTTNITSQVRAGTYRIDHLAPHAAVTLKVKITATTSAAAGSGRRADLTVRSTTTRSAVDTVRARVTRT